MDNNKPVFVDSDIEPDKGGRAYDCARCGGEHSLTYRSFKNKPIEGYDKWAMCPVTNDPVLIKITNYRPILN